MKKNKISAPIPEKFSIFYICRLVLPGMNEKKDREIDKLVPKIFVCLMPSALTRRTSRMPPFIFM